MKNLGISISQPTVVRVIGNNRKMMLPLIKISNNAKVNAQYNIDNIFKPHLERGIQRINPNEEEKVPFHPDKANKPCC